MKRRTTKFGLLALILTMALAAAACGDSSDEGSGDTTETTEAARSDTCRTLDFQDVSGGGELTDYAQLSSSGDNTSFDPAVVQTLDEAQVTNALFDGLTEYDFTDTCNPELKGLVADSWEANDDATEFTFTIKDGLTFTNGEPILPHNFKQAWERFGSAELASPYGYLMSYVKGGSTLLDGTATTLDSITADDENMTLTVEMEDANADFPAIASFNGFSPISDEDLARVGNTTGWGKKGAYIGNGPYMLESADTPDSGTVVIVKNPDWAGNIYGDTEANLDKITFVLSADVASAYQAFESGEGDTATIPSGSFAQAQANYPNTVSDAVLGSYFFDIGSTFPSLMGDENLKLRQAISLAIDREEVNQKAYEGTRVISTGITPPGIPGFEADLCDYCTFDPEQAKSLYDEWIADGNDPPTDLTLDFNSGGGHEAVVQVMQANLKENLGLDVQLNGIDQDYFQEIAKEGACSICRSGWYADYPTYGNFMVDLFGAVSIDGNNLGRFDNPEFEDLIAQAQAETDDTKRGELYASAEKVLLNDQTAAIPLNWYTGDQVYREGVENYVLPPMGLYLWEKMGKQAG